MITSQGSTKKRVNTDLGFSLRIRLKKTAHPSALNYANVKRVDVNHAAANSSSPLSASPEPHIPQPPVARARVKNCSRASHALAPLTPTLKRSAAVSDLPTPPKRSKPTPDGEYVTPSALEAAPQDAPPREALAESSPLPLLRRFGGKCPRELFCPPKLNLWLFGYEGLELTVDIKLDEIRRYCEEVHAESQSQLCVKHIVELATAQFTVLDRCTLLHRLAAELRIRERLCAEEPQRPAFSAFPAPPPHATAQRFETLEELLSRFYEKGILPAVSQCNLADTVEELFEGDMDEIRQLDLASLFAQDNTEAQKSFWFFLWVTCCELLEWYLVRGACLFDYSNNSTPPPQYGRSLDSVPQKYLVRDEIRAIQSIRACWRTFSARPSHYKVCNIAYESACARYVDEVLHDRLVYLLQQLESRVDLREHIVYKTEYMGALPACDDVHAALRSPQIERLPPGWTWRRQVRTRHGKHFGTQDTLFYPNWKDNYESRGRCRSYEEIKRYAEK